MRSIIQKAIAGLSAISQHLATYGAAGAFLIALLDSAMIPMPGGPDAAVMLLCATRPGWLAWYVLAASAGSMLGCLILYTISMHAGSRALGGFSAERKQRVLSLIDRYDALAVLVASILPPPFPFKAFVVTAGVFQLNRVRFAAAVGIGRVFRFSLEGYLAARYQDEAKYLFVRYYPTIGLGLAVLLILGFILFGFWQRRKSALSAPKIR